MAAAPVKEVTGMEKLKANELFLRVHGKLKDRDTGGRVTVQIGFLQASQPQQAMPTAIGSSAQVMPQVMPSRPVLAIQAHDDSALDAE